MRYRILPPYLRRAKSIEELLPWLYLKGISTGDFCEALAALEAKVARLEKELHTAHTILDVQGKVAGLLGFSLEHGKDC